MLYVKACAILTLSLFGTVLGTSIVNSSSPSIDDICSLLPRSATILRPNSCNKWFKCPTTPESNDFEEGACVMGLYYNKDHGRCEYEDMVSCPYKVAEKNRCAKREDGTFLPDGDSCKGYIFCASGREMHSTCPGDLVFYPEKASCVYRQEYNCPERTKNDAVSPICRSIGNSAFFANDLDCAKYYECSNDTLINHDCGKDLAFDHVMGRCVPRENVVCHPTAKAPLPENTVCGSKEQPRVGYFSDDKSCSGYYICSKKEDGPDRNPEHISCEAGYFFDAEKWSCRDRLNVKCHLDRCEGMGSKYVNVAGNCSAYARCNNGVAVTQGNCPPKYYFDERTQGCTPQNINYAACST